MSADGDNDTGKRRKLTCGGSFLRLPLEVLSADFRRDRKDIERELLLIHNFIASGKVGSAGNSAETVEKLLKKLDIVEKRLYEKKREQAKLVDNIKHRVTAIDDLASADEVADEELAEWEGSDTFLLVEWLARNGFAHTLRRVVENSKTGSMDHFPALESGDFEPDIVIDEKIRSIKEALKNGNVTPAIEWYKACRNRIDKMQKLPSKEDSEEVDKQESFQMGLLPILHFYEMTRILEDSDPRRFELAVEYLEKIVKDGDIVGPYIEFACRIISCGIRGKHEHHVGDENGSFWCIQSSSTANARLTAALEQLDIYTRFVYYNDDPAVAENGSMLELLVRAGVFALASPTCLSNANSTCPCCDPLCHSWGFQKGMEHPTRLRSHLVCPYTGRIMEQALASPGGHVVSSQCMALLLKGNGSVGRSGRVRCPVTGKEYDVDEYTRIFPT